MTKKTSYHLSYGGKMKNRNILRISIIIILLLFIVFRHLFPNVNFDQLSFNILLVAILVLIFPRISDLASLIETVKYERLEIKLKDNLDRLSMADQLLNRNVSIEESQYIPGDVKQRVINNRYNHRMTFMSISIEIEQKLKILLEDFQLAKNPGYFSPRIALQKLHKSGHIDSNSLDIFNTFWETRNAVLHSNDFERDSFELDSLINYGIQLLDKIYRIENKDHRSTN